MLADTSSCFAEGSIAAVLKQAGDAVAMDETIMQIETDKVMLECQGGSLIPAGTTVFLILCHTPNGSHAFL